MQYISKNIHSNNLPPNINGGSNTCHLCGEDIYEGDIFYSINGQRYHKSCLTEAYTKEELLSLMGVKKQHAVKEIKAFVIGEKNGK